MKKGFTLMEVNLAILIMAGGILSVMGLYSLGFRESRQSSEDVASAVYADAVLSPLTMAISATNLKWSVFRSLGNYPSKEGWRDYFDNNGNVVQNPESKARAAFSSMMGEVERAAQGSLDVPKTWPDASASGGLNAGLVILHKRDSAVVKIGFRATKQAGLLLGSPLYYTEVRFQGIADK